MILSKALYSLFSKTRQYTEAICKPLQTEDYVVQPVVYVSPPKWHLAHTSWFFEEFILKKYKPDYKVFHKDFSYIFNSYYENVGRHILRVNRGNLSRPSVSTVYEYRDYVTKEMKILLQSEVPSEVENILWTGIHHEKQHQELLFTDIKYILGHHPLFPKYEGNLEENPIQDVKQEWITIEEGVYEIGYDGKGDFCYDNELGRHKVYIPTSALSSTLVTNQEYLEFMKGGGYEDFNLWHAEGLDWKKKHAVSQPMYWHKIEGKWYQYTLQGIVELVLEAPVSHISFYEAHAYAAWRACRLPTEFEWEVAQEKLHWGSRWEWTESAYLAYPNFKKATGALGEYNGKFMLNQKVLRGKSVATSPKHSRVSYRNYFHPPLRWQFTGIRLAK